MKPKIGMHVVFNPDGTDRRWHGEITAVHNDSTVNATFIDEDDNEIEKPDIHFCAKGETCEVSMCQAAPKTSGKPTVEDIAEAAADAAEEVIEEIVDELLNKAEEKTHGE